MGAQLQISLHILRSMQRARHQENCQGIAAATGWEPSATMLGRWRLNLIPIIRQSGLPFRVTDSDWLVVLEKLSVQSRVRVRVRGGGVTSKEIDCTWMCDSMETRDAAPQVCPRSRETKDGALSGVSATDEWRVTWMWQRPGPWCTGSLPFQSFVLPNPCLCMDTWTRGR